jgi:CHAT domain-containing protein/tetratricopeptide (TPR) repeat protein
MKALLIALWLVAFTPLSFAEDPTVTSLLEKARILRQSGKPAEARPAAQQAVTLAESQREWKQLVSARTELSFEESSARNYDRVLQLRLANLDTVRAHHQEFLPLGEQEALASVGAAYSWNRNYPLAIRFCRADLAASQAYEQSQGSPSALVPHALQRLGINLYLAGQYDEAQDVLRKAYAKYVAFAELTKQTQALWYYESQVEVLRWLERVLIAQKHIEEALEASELGRSRALEATLASRADPRAEPASPSVEKIRTIAREHGATIVEFSVLYDYNPDLLFLFSNFEDIPVASIYAWVIQPDGKITFHESAFPRQGPSLAQMVRQARSSAGANGRGLILEAEPGAARARPLQDLHTLLIAPILMDLPHDPNQIVTLVPQDWLFLVPFAALQDGRGHYLIEQHPLSATPSLGILDLTHQEFTSARQGKGALIVGNPTMPSLVTEPGGATEKLNQLPGAEQEARIVAVRLHAPPLVGSAATKDQVLLRLSNAEIAHFATHGLLDQATGGFQSALALAPAGVDNGFLTTREIENLKLNADLVVLSACDTARGKMSGDGILGLSRSFMTAGVPSVIVSLWAISDESTAYLMDNFYQKLEEGQNKAKSLQSAMLNTMGRYPAPLNWAAFVLMGETAVAPGSRHIEGGPELTPADKARAADFAIPLPPNISDLREDPDANFKGMTSDTSYTVPMSVAEVVRFYKRELESRGLKEVTNLEQVEATGFSIVYRGPWVDREVVIQGSRAGNNCFVSIRFEPRRGQ